MKNFVFGYARVSTQQQNLDRQLGDLKYCEIPRSKKELADFLGISSVSYGMKRYIEPLVEQGSIAMTEPDNPGSRSQRYFSKV